MRLAVRSLILFTAHSKLLFIRLQTPIFTEIYGSNLVCYLPSPIHSNYVLDIVIVESQTIEPPQEATWIIIITRWYFTFA